MAVQAVTLADIEALARVYAQDNDATSANYGVTSTIAKQIINRYYVALKQGQDARVVDLSATATGLTVSSFKAITTLATIRKILAAYIAPSAGSTSPFSDTLERCKLSEIEEWRTDYPATGTVARYAAVRTNSNATPPTPDFWTIHVHPTPTSATYIMLRAEMETVLLSNATDAPECTDDEAMGLATLTGAWIARRIGRGALADSILQEVPASMAALATLITANKRPKRREGEEAA